MWAAKCETTSKYFNSKGYNESCWPCKTSSTFLRSVILSQTSTCASKQTVCKLLCLLEPSFFLILLFYKKSYKHAVHNNVKSRRRIHRKSTINQSCWLRIVGFVCHVSCTTHKTSVVCLILITSLQQQYSIWKENIHMFYTKA